MKNGGAPSTSNSRCKGPELGVCNWDKVQQEGSPHGWSMREKGRVLLPTVLKQPSFWVGQGPFQEPHLSPVTSPAALSCPLPSWAGRSLEDI